MEVEKLKAILLATACFFMACLNLWNIFKDWFDNKYQSRQEDKKRSSPTKDLIPDIVGKSKFKLKEKSISKQAEQELIEPANPLKKEIAELKELVLQQSKMIEENKPFMSIPMEKKEVSDIDPDTIDDETIPVLTEKERSQFSTGTTLDEFELVVRTLKDNPITKEEEVQVEHIIPKIEGTDIYNQFTKQIHGAEERAMAILNRIEDNRQALSGNGDEGFDFRRFVRE
ncbi:hypothetical protein M2459_001957 [Parabacteroides sp. PF5-5]|uniref:hypothetical protein n=1 Tax=unclassified Parabacteroides TaxID=2649774 RepID=UPI00247475A4|nr:MULTISPECIES: hypothetical protein [unclassified Parabacteroides]MDH6306723.1 hypothetical protein [Parabacteroides sp. PH5-39]MDH6316214.1 hypothetical protein [Parabacteroides sp. PF5-13]MDH6321425.1 hypothetical protein [Parabacteroides sp. PH5-13]MDH6325156.1 hypothetical protein [Parabacteroides sp. PH5-8]MDH6327405.1 hypothetical protein [Parabacteroides sp. PH5-41]